MHFEMRAFVAVASALICVAYADGNTMVISRKKVETTTARIEENGKQSADGKASLPGLWISQLFQEAERNFSMLGPNVNDACRRDFETYRLHLQNQSVWAVRMFESSEWPTVGILFGSRYHMGHWRQCMMVKGPKMQGQSCLVQANLDFKFDVKSYRSKSDWLEYPDPSASTWAVLKLFEKQPARVNRHKQYWALCIPSSCTSSDLVNSVDHAVNPVFEKHNIHASITVEPKFCTVQKQNHYSSGFILTAGLLLVIIFAVIASTAYDLSQEEDDKRMNQSWRKVVRCLSMKCNYQRLIETPKTHNYPSLYAVKFFCMYGIIYAHRMMYVLGSPLTESEGVEVTYRPLNLELVSDGIVDSFFACSGFLTVLLGIAPMKKGGVIYMVFSVIVRWLRMIPILGIVMLFVMYVLPYFGSGPFWMDRIGREITNCQENWWANLLALSNVINPERQCLILSYYVAVDIQLSIVGAILLFVIVRNKKIGISLLALTLLVGTAITFAVVYARKYYGHFQFFMNHLAEPRNIEEFTHLYIAMYPRMGPYLVGVGSAYLSTVLMEKNFKLTHTQVYTMVALSTLVGIGSQFYGFEFYKDGKPYWALGNALFASVHRLLFILPFTVGFVLYVTTGKTIFQAVLNNQLFIPLGRLVYCALLSSFTLQLYHVSGMKTPITSLSRTYFIWTAIGDTALAYLTAFFMHLFLEGPFNSLIKVTLDKLLESHKSRDDELEEKPRED